MKSKQPTKQELAKFNRLLQSNADALRDIATLPLWYAPGSDTIIKLHKIFKKSFHSLEDYYFKLQNKYGEEAGFKKFERLEL